MAIRTEIIVALIGVTGVISAAVIANSDKLFGNRAPPSAAQPAASAQVAVPQAGPHEPSPSASQGLPEVGGTWLDNDGSRFEFTQAGASYGFVQVQGGRQVGQGTGLLNGHSFEHRFEAEGVGAGSCSGTVAGDGRTSSGHCRADGGGEWDFTIVRPSPDL